jgi:hypothetical protein
MNSRKRLFKMAWKFNNRNKRKEMIKIIKQIKKGLIKDAKKGKFSTILTTTEDRHANHYLNIIVFRWLLRYSKYEPILVDETIFVSSKNTRYIEIMKIEFNWDLIN